RGPPDRPIAADLGGALTALIGERRERVLDAILDIDEPTVLAQMLSFAPRASRDRIGRRIAALTPSDPREIRSLTGAQGRMEELWSAGLADAATKFMEAERGLRTFGKAPGRELSRLRTDLRLKLLRHDWTGIASTQPPSELSGAERDS